ncbi:GNAT family N-acetyltransferase [Zavarzinia sp. CC-PAN008]|uniref:GNAT family N-acetyltransferase n=1 Tax=Zavarzinia sp. CC-PAN008 TaxID=3243332 RepID=UPI003F748E51
MLTIGLEQPHDAAAIEQLLDASFGPSRNVKTVYRLRDGVDPLPELSFVAHLDGAFCGTLRFWPIWVGETPALLLGPIAVDGTLRSVGIGQKLMAHGLEEARRLGHKVVILVGDLDYYQRMGFSREGAENLVMPGWVDRQRLLVRGLVPGALDGLSGRILNARGEWVEDEARAVA